MRRTWARSCTPHRRPSDTTSGFLQDGASPLGMVAGSPLSGTLGIVAMMNLSCVGVALAAATVLLMPRHQPPVPEEAPLGEAA
ncbi:hypothetical protein ACH47Z_14455 [Streptomyces sp. NPDC020192]|uniref:hypothetical protein n=1 Tax=Streptomyces sp. NPDC020192 TaxID=3365066 RepID=UPI00378A3BD0